jgi:hypothetical protein
MFPPLEVAEEEVFFNTRILLSHLPE